MISLHLQIRFIHSDLGQMQHSKALFNIAVITISTACIRFEAPHQLHPSIRFKYCRTLHYVSPLPILSATWRMVCILYLVMGFPF